MTENNQAIRDKIKKLKSEAGSHSPSIFTYKQKIPELQIKVDACFLSNPYATELFLKYFKEEILDTNKIRDLLEFYPSQNNIIAELLADFLNINSENIFIGNGAIEVIQAVIHNFTKTKIAICIPTFSSYYEFVKPGTDICYYTLQKSENYELNIDNYLTFVENEKPDTVVLINPNNPNGAYINRENVGALLSKLKHVNTVILDESFIHFAYEDDSYKMVSMAQLINDYPNLVVLKSMSKDFGIAGIRAGYGIMSKERVATLLANGYLWNSNGFSEYFFRLYTRADFAYHYNEVRVKYIMETMDFIEKLKSIKNIKIYPSKANFILVELLGDINSDVFVADMLINYGIYLRTCSDKIGLEGEYIRLASRNKSENDYIISCFETTFNK